MNLAPTSIEAAGRAPGRPKPAGVPLRDRLLYPSDEGQQ
jgi:hypothetical protein